MKYRQLYRRKYKIRNRLCQKTKQRNSILYRLIKKERRNKNDINW